MSSVRFTLKYGDKTKEIEHLESENLTKEVLEITENKLILSSLICSHVDYDRSRLIIFGFLRLSVKKVLSDDLMNLMVDYYYIERRVSALIPLERIYHSRIRIKDGDTIVVRKDTTPDDEMFGIVVKRYNGGQKTPIKVKASSTIKDVKRSMDIEDCMHRCYILACRSCLLSDDEMNMIECGIAPGDILYLFMRK